MGWEVHPEGLLSTLTRFSKHGLPILVTENGVATDDEELRTRFVRQHVAMAGQALQNGTALLGYLYWSLIDNFEWTHGTTPRFGLAAVDYATQERRPRPGADAFSEICRERRVSTSDSG